MNETLINNLYTLVETACKSEKNVFGYGIWSHHIKPMVGIAKGLANEYGADEEIVVIASLLHDLAGIKDESKRKEHHFYGAEEADGILSDYGYKKEKIEKVKKCIYNHRGSVNNKKGSMEELCVADADAIAHIQEIGSLFYVAYKEMDMDIDQGTGWIKEKIEKDWRKMSKNGKTKFKQRYEEILRVIG
ncbi:MAG: HD domain-containing protein [Rectinemataceae bacterium]